MNLFIFLILLNSIDEPNKDLGNLQVTADKMLLRNADVSTSVSIITHDEMFTRNNALLPDLLRGEAGIFVQQTTPGQGIPIIRGLKGSQNIHLVDGMRINTSIFRNAPNQYLALIDPFLSSQIEVVRGPSSVLYGGDAMGGVVNIISHQPVFMHTSDWSTQGQFYASINSAEQRKLGHVTLDAANNKVATTFGLSIQDTNTYISGGGEHIPFSAYKSRAFNNKWLFKVDESLSWGIDYQQLTQPETSRVDALIPGFGESEPDSSLFLFKPNQRQFLHLFVVNEKPNLISDRSEFHLAWQKIRDDRLRQKFNSETITHEQNDSSLFSLQASWNKQTTEDSHWLYGVDYWYDNIDSSRQFENPDSLVTIKPRFPDDSSMQSFGIYTENRRNIGRHTWTTGLRFSHYFIDLNRGDLGSNDSLKLNDLSWHAGWLYRLNQNDRLVANLGRGFRPPNIFDLGQTGSRPGNRFNVINPKLKPETVITLDIGWKHAGNGWTLDSSLFASHYQDSISSVETGAISPEGQIIIQSQNINQVRLYGFESAFSYWNKYGGHFSTVLNYTWGQENTATGKQPADRIPPLSGKLEYTQPLAPQLDLQARLRFAAKQTRLSQRDIDDPRINPQGTDGYSALDLYISWHTHADQIFRLGVTNLLDEEYRQHASGVNALGRNFEISFNQSF